MMLLITQCSCWIALLLLIFFRTEAWLEYSRLFHLDCISYYKDFNSKFKDDMSLKYLTYLRRNHNCFFVRLITCPICLTAWLGLFISLLTIPLLFPVYVIGGLLLFLIIDKLLG